MNNGSQSTLAIKHCTLLKCERALERVANRLWRIIAVGSVTYGSCRLWVENVSVVKTQMAERKQVK